jgi:hypothetical protein
VAIGDVTKSGVSFNTRPSTVASTDGNKPDEAKLSSDHASLSGLSQEQRENQKAERRFREEHVHDVDKFNRWATVIVFIALPAAVLLGGLIFYLAMKDKSKTKPA